MCDSRDSYLPPLKATRTSVPEWDAWRFRAQRDDDRRNREWKPCYRWWSGSCEVTPLRTSLYLGERPSLSISPFLHQFFSLTFSSLFIKLKTKMKMKMHIGSKIRDPFFLLRRVLVSFYSHCVSVLLAKRLRLKVLSGTFGFNF